MAVADVAAVGAVGLVQTGAGESAALRVLAERLSEGVGRAVTLQLRPVWSRLREDP